MWKNKSCISFFILLYLSNRSSVIRLGVIITNNNTCSVNAIDKIKVNRVEAQLADNSQTVMIADLFKALSDPTRLRIVQALLIEELCVCDISAIINISISAISHQLRLLRSMKIVKNRKQGKMVYYSLTDEHIRELINIADEHIHEER